MAKLINKTFDMLELLGSDPGKSFSVTEASNAIGISKAAAGRILIDFLERGYAYQRGNRGDYSLGPMAYRLASKWIFRKDLIDASSETIKHFAHEVMHESIGLTVMHARRRYILVTENGNPHLNLQPYQCLPWYDDFYDSATGRQLLANASESEISDYLRTHPLPTPYFPEVKTDDDFRAELAKIKAAPYLSYRCFTPQFWILAFPIRLKGHLEASIGIMVPFESFKPPYSDSVIGNSGRCAKIIEEKLLKIHSPSRQQ